MFGKNKALMEDFQSLKEEFEACDEIISKLHKDDVKIQAANVELRESGKQVSASVTQIAENMDNAAAMAHENVEASHRLKDCMTQIHKDNELSETRRQDLESEIEQMYQTCMELVESNKHYTDSSKNMTDATEKLLDGSKNHLARLEEMSNLGKEMSVVALNSAIEAGRLGESGKQFVSAAEEVRLLATQYEASVVDLTKEVKEQEEVIQSLEDEVKRLISLLKDSNVASSKLMKRSAQTIEAARGLAQTSLSMEMNEMCGMVNEISASQEEVAKMQERNRMQLSDIEEELETQSNYMQELSDIISPILSEVESYAKRSINNE